MINSNEYIPTGNYILDDFVKNGIPSGKISLIVGKSRQTGASYTHKRLLFEWKKANRTMKLIRLFKNI